MGRYWFILTSGKYPGMAAETNATIDLQTAGAVQGGLREGMDAYFTWMESLAQDYRTNARNAFGLRGAVYPLFPDKGIGASFYYTGQLHLRPLAATGSPQAAGACASSGITTW